MSILTGKIICFIMILFHSYNNMLYAEDKDELEVGKFSKVQIKDGLPVEWKPLTFKKIPQHTRYSLVKNNGYNVVKAVSRRSASGLIRKISINPVLYPIIRWQWKITGVFSKGDVTQKDGDDYPARVYITFAYDPEKVGFFEKIKYEVAYLFYGEYPPISAINYIWANKAPMGTLVDNPYTSRVKMIVLQSGSLKKGLWITEEHNIYKDYQKAFGEPPPMISGIAIMTDSDNTKASTISYFGDIIFKKHATSPN